MNYLNITKSEFEKMVTDALGSLPYEFSQKLDNVGVTIEEWPTKHDLISTNTDINSTLFGLYRGVPRTQRENYAAALPDKIVIFAGPILTFVGKDKDKLRVQIRKTLLHEIGHHFGMTEEQIRKAEKS